MPDSTPYRLQIEYRQDWPERVLVDGQEVNARGLRLDAMPERYVLWAPLQANGKRDAITLLLQSDSTTSRDNEAIAAILSVPDAIATLVAQDRAQPVAQLMQLAVSPFNLEAVLALADRDIRLSDIAEPLKTAWWDAASRMPTPSLLGDDGLGLYSGNPLYIGKPEGGLHPRDTEALSGPFQPFRGISSLLRGLAAKLGRHDR